MVKEGINITEKLCAAFAMVCLWTGLPLEVELTKWTESSLLCRVRPVRSTGEREWPYLLREFFLTPAEEQFLLQHILMSSLCFLGSVFLGSVLWEEYANSTQPQVCSFITAKSKYCGANFLPFLLIAKGSVSVMYNNIQM